MNKFKNYIYVLLGCVLFSSCGESLEDTYAEFLGEKRYIGSISDFEALPGWERVSLKWKNNVDPTIKRTKIVWQNGNEADSVFVDRGVSEYDIKTFKGDKLDDAVYVVTVTAVNDRGGTSVPQTRYCRPYTPNHEAVRGFTRLVSKVYVVKHRLVLAMSGWSDEVKSASLSYTRQDGVAATLQLTKDICDSHYYLLPDAIDETKPITVQRSGTLPGITDVITFDPYLLDTGKTFDSGFRQEMLAQYGLMDLTDDWVNNVNAIYIDYDITTLADIMNFPNLKKLVLGSRRYESASGADNPTYGQSVVSDVEATNFAVKLMGELYGTQVEVYGKNFPGITGFNVKRKGLPTQPSVKFYDLTGADITCSPESEYVWMKSHVENLIDGDAKTFWNPPTKQDYTKYTIVLDMKSENSLKGVRVIQRNFDDSPTENPKAPARVRIYVSKNNLKWYSATYLEDCTIGRSSGEATYIKFTPAIAAEKYQYVKLVVDAIPFQGFFDCQLAELSVY